MAIDIGPKIGIQGEAQFRAELRSINTGIKTLGSEMKAVTSEFIGQEKSVESLAKQNDVLGRTALSLTEKLEKSQEMLRQCAQAYGEADERTQKWQQVVNNTTADLNKTNAQIRENAEAMEELGSEEKSTGGITSMFQGTLDKLGISMSQLTMAGVVGLVVAGVKKLVDVMNEAVHAGAAYADNINTLSTNYGIATQALQAYQYMAELVDTDVDTITGSIAKLTRNMDAARNGTGEAAEAFQKLGIQVTDGEGKLRNANDVFLEAIDHLGYIESGSERDALAMDLFGKSAMELNSLIAAGSEGMTAYAREAQKMGFILSDQDLAALNSVQDSFDRMDNMMTAIKNQIGAEMAPALADLARQLLEVAQQVDWREFGQAAAMVIRDLTPAVVTLVESIAGLVMILGELAEKERELRENGGLWGSTGLGYSIGSAIRKKLVPGLAAGGVVEPNNPGLYVLGDNTREREIVSPRSEMVAAVKDALADSKDLLTVREQVTVEMPFSRADLSLAFSEAIRHSDLAITQSVPEPVITAPVRQDAGLDALRTVDRDVNVTIKYTGDLAQLGRVMNPVVTADKARVGAVI